MLLSKGRHVLGLIQKCGVRSNTGYVSPKFKGGEAKPHEIGRTIRQKLFHEGEFYVSVPLFIILAGAFLIMPIGKKMQDFGQARMDEWRTIYNYPYAEREE